MALPEFNEFGDLPEGRHSATLDEVIARFGSGTAQRNDELGASVFWIRPEMLLGESLEKFFDFWQTTRDGRRRGVVEIKP